MVLISNKIIIFSLLGVVFGMLSVAKEPTPQQIPPTKSQQIPIINRGHHGQGQRGHGNRGHHQGHRGHHGHSYGALPISKGAELPPPQYMCPSGYELQENNTCFREIITPPKEICPYGTLIAPGKCALISPAIFKCPADYEHSGQGCTYIETETFLEECPPGSVPCTNGCCMTEISSVEMICPLPQINKKHKKDGNTSCVRFEEVQPEPFCLNNFQLNGEFCTGIQMAPCPPKPKVAPPPVKKSTPPRKLGGKNRPKQNFPQTDFCPTQARIPAGYRCPPGSITNEERKHHHRGGLTCLLPKPIPLQPVCRLPGGIISPDGTTCEATKIVPPIKRCPADFNDCSQLLSVANIGADQCCKLITTPPTPYCNKGEFIEGKCKIYSSSEYICYGSSTLIEGMCREPDTRPALTQSLPSRSHKKH